MVIDKETKPGVIEISISTNAYGLTGKHWESVLGKKNHGYGKIYIQRFGTVQRRYYSTWPNKDDYKGERSINQDECPGAMFIWTTPKPASVEAVDAISNQALGRDIGNALRKYPQNDPRELWEVIFKFI